MRQQRIKRKKILRRILLAAVALVILLAILFACMPHEPTPKPPHTDTGSTSTDGTASVTDTGNVTDTGTNTDTQAPEASFDLVISEVMAENKRLCLGNNLDWVEIYNREDTSVLLDTYYLTDDPAKPAALSLEGKTVAANGFLAISLDELGPFNLSSQGETVYLMRNGEIVSQLTFPLSENGESFGQDGVCEYPTPGYPNTEDGYTAYLNSITLPELIINEVVSSNSKYLAVKNEYYDLVEVLNRSDTPIRLSDYSLSDKRKEPTRFTFPDVTLQPGEYYVVYCSGNPSLGDAHTSFKISSEGETLYLAKGGVIIDVLSVPGDLKRDESFGRDGNLPVYLKEATLGGANSTGYLKGVATPLASAPSGVYAEAQTITLTGQGTIYYTLDGSRPTTSSAVYTAPIPVNGVVTLRAFCVDGERTGSMTAYTYVIGQTHQLPIVTVSIPQDKLTGSKGILNNIKEDYEYEAVLTLIENGEEKFSVPFGFRLHGNDSRKGDKQNFQLRFRSEYGVGKLYYPLFDDRTFSDYNSLLLKGGSEDWNAAMMRDEVCTETVNGTTALYAQAMKPVVLYLGGEYWGIYYLRERFSDDYVASHRGVSAESVDILYSTAGYLQTGSTKEYKALLNYVDSHDMSTSANFGYLCERVDINSLIDWHVCRGYFGDKDYANIRRFRSDEDDGKWRWMFFDMDWAFYHTTDAPISGTIKNGGEKKLIAALLKSKEGRDAFLRRCNELMDTVLNEEYITGVIDSIASAIESEIPRDRERWGKTVKSWESAVNKLRNYVKDGKRTNRVLNDIQDYFDLSDGEMTEYFG